MAQKLVVLTFILVFFTGCLAVDEKGQLVAVPDSVTEPAPDQAESPDETVDPAEEFEQYDPLTYVDDRSELGKSMATIQYDDNPSYATCQAIASYKARDDRVLYLTNSYRNTFLHLENSYYNYYVSVRHSSGNEHDVYRAKNCSGPSTPIWFTFGQCQIELNDFCANYWDSSANHFDFKVRWFVDPDFTSIHSGDEYVEVEAVE